MIVAAFWGGLSELVNRWDNQEEYSHGYLIPLVTAYLIWQRKDFLKSLEFKPTWFPVIFVALGITVSVIGEISAIYVLIHFSLIMIILAMAWALMGWHAFKYVLIPLALLGFAIPLPYFLEAALTADLQLISSNLGVAFIRLFGIPVYAEGNVIDLGIYQANRIVPRVVIDNGNRNVLDISISYGCETLQGDFGCPVIYRDNRNWFWWH